MPTKPISVYRDLKVLQMWGFLRLWRKMKFSVDCLNIHNLRFFKLKTMHHFLADSDNVRRYLLQNLKDYFSLKISKSPEFSHQFHSLCLMFRSGVFKQNITYLSVFISIFEILSHNNNKVYTMTVLFLFLGASIVCVKNLPDTAYLVFCESLTENLFVHTLGTKIT